MPCRFWKLLPEAISTENTVRILSGKKVCIRYSFTWLDNPNYLYRVIGLLRVLGQDQLLLTRSGGPRIFPDITVGPVTESHLRLILQALSSSLHMSGLQRAATWAVR